jgi:transcriptional regulator with XRE-family HTH domain
MEAMGAESHIHTAMHHEILGAEGAEGSVKEVRELREHMGLSQQAFASELGLSMRAVANYEKDRRPEPRVFIPLMKAAEKANRADLLRIFLIAFMADINLTWSDLQRFANSSINALTMSSSGV